MQSLIIIAVVAFAAGEVPSNSYLPPPNRGYPKESPVIVDARTFDHDLVGHGLGDHGAESVVTANGFARNGVRNINGSPQTRFNGNEDQGYDQNAAALARNAVEDTNATTINYGADYRGIKPQISLEDTDDIARSAYNGNANNFGSVGYQGNEQNGGRSDSFN